MLDGVITVCSYVNNQWLVLNKQYRHYTNSNVNINSKTIIIIINKANSIHTHNYTGGGGGLKL